MKTDFFNRRSSTIMPMEQESGLPPVENGCSTTIPNRERVLKRRPVQERKSPRKQRTCICCLLVLILLLVSALLVAGFFIFRSCTCECALKNIRKENSSSETVSSFISPKYDTLGSRGVGFILLFMKNVGPSIKSVWITSDTSVQVNISSSFRLDPPIKINIDKTLTVASYQKIVLPSELELESYKREPKAILIETSAAVSVTSYSNGYANVGSTTHMPLDKLSTRYVVISTEPHGQTNSQLAVAAIGNNTFISITFKMRRNLPLYTEGKIFYDGDTLHILLDMLETYQISHVTDLTGTVVESSAPVAAFSGNDCNMLKDVGTYDHLIEQLPATKHVDNTYIVPPNSDFRDTIIRITAIETSTVAYIIDVEKRSLHLNKFDYFDTQISSRQMCFIRCQSPIIVTGFGMASINSSLGDPSMIIIPGINQYLNYYKIAVPTGDLQNYISIMIRSSSVDFLRINGMTTMNADVLFEGFIVAGSDHYSVKLIKVSDGEICVFTTNGERFGLISSGEKIGEAYAFSGNSVSP